MSASLLHPWSHYHFLHLCLVALQSNNTALRSLNAKARGMGQAPPIAQPDLLVNPKAKVCRYLSCVDVLANQKQIGIIRVSTTCNTYQAFKAQQTLIPGQSVGCHCCRTCALISSFIHQSWHHRNWHCWDYFVWQTFFKKYMWPHDQTLWALRPHSSLHFFDF